MKAGIFSSKRALPFEMSKTEETNLHLLSSSHVLKREFGRVRKGAAAWKKVFTRILRAKGGM